MKVSTILLSISLLLAPMSAMAHRPSFPVNEEYSRQSYVNAEGRTMPYRMLKPEVRQGEQYPLVVFLHGSGERGDDNEKQLTYGASLFSNPSNVNKYPAFVIFPQCREKSWISTNDSRVFMPGAETPAISESEQMVVDLVKDVINNNPVNPSRVYIVGLSMGAIAAYDLTCRFPELFAAAVPICGAVNPERLADAKDVNFMIFHGEEDEEVPNLCSREAYKALTAAGAEVEYIEFAGLGHDCWSSAFNYPTLLPWLFSQTKSPQAENLADSH